MLRKAFLATSALVVASSMAVAGTHQLTHQSLATLKQMHRNNLVKKGMIVSQKGIALGVRFQGQTHGVGKPAKFVPGTGYTNFSKSPNALFISWFGWFGGATSAQSGPFSGSFCESYSGSVCINRYKYRYSISDQIHQSAAQPFHGKGSATSLTVATAQYSGSGGAHAGLYSDNGGAPGGQLGGGDYNSAPAFTGLCCSSVETVTFPTVVLSKKKQYWVVVSQNSDGANGRVAWEGQARDWTQYPGGEDYNANIHEVIQSTYGTTRFNNFYTYHTSFNSSTGGWIHTSSFTFEAQPGAFSVN